MTNRVFVTNIRKEKKSTDNLSNIKTCFDRFKGIDVISVSRNGLVLSTLRKKI